MSVSVKYKGAEIASMAETGTKTLLTSGKYCDADIVVENTKDSGGEPSATVAPSDITFIDYDGTVVASWTLAELASKTALPDYPSHAGLICQGWNWTLEDLKATNRAMNVGAMYVTDDGKTRIYIRLEEGRTFPMLGCCPNGTVTVDWGDGTTPDTLAGTSTSDVKWTPNHNYAAPGDYVITFTVDGTVGFYGESSGNQYSGLLRYSSGADARNTVYQNSIKRIEIGNGVTSIGSSAFYYCYSLCSITIPNSVTSIGNDVFYNCYSLSSITIPNSITSIRSNVFRSCLSLFSITIPNSVTSIGNDVFYNCYSLFSIAIPNSVTSIGSDAFRYCYSLSSITIPNSITSIGSSTFTSCYSLSSITIPNSVTSIGFGAFSSCYGIAFYDFTSHAAVPTYIGDSAFSGIAADCQIRVPAALVDEWKATRDWAKYADYIVGV